jgi:hydrogenase maturation factor HypF (carbamoyltransferase family)
MENNNVYNLMNQMTQESKSLWRIKNIYHTEAESEELKAFWMKQAEQKEQAITELKELIKNAL